MKKLIVLTLVSALLLAAPVPSFATAAAETTASELTAAEEVPLTYSKAGTAAAVVERKIYDFLKNRMNFNDATTCGILANIFVECSFNPNDSYIESSGATSYGICQWNNSRLENLKNYCAANGYDYTTVEGQLEFMCYELTLGEEKNAYRMMQGISNDASGAYTAGYNWARYYERCASSSYVRRATLARDSFWTIYGRYVPIGLNVPYYSVAGEVGSLQAAVSICESYYKGYPAGADTVIKTVLTADLSGYTEEAVDLSAIFTHLNKGDPVILQDGSGKCSVIYGYDGDATVLKASGFCLLTPSGAASADNSYETLDVWLTYHADSICLVRTADSVELPILPVENRRLSVRGWICPVNLPEGESFPIAGRLLSSSPIVSVTLTLSSEGEVLGSGEVSPMSVTYDLSTLKSDIDFSALAAGEYSLTLSATDEKGAQLQKEKTFTVSDMPISGCPAELYADSVGDIGDAAAGIYRVTSSNGLNMREGPGTEYDRILVLSYDTEVNVTEINEDGWGKAEYGNYVGWIFMEYAEYVSDGISTVTYVAEGASGVPDPQTKVVDIDLILTDVIPIRTGYAFLGWSTSSTATAAEYLPGGVYSTDKDVTLYAVWQRVGTDKESGDVNGDGSVNLKDYAYLERYLDGWAGLIDESMADVNRDGDVNENDLTLLRQILAG